MPSPKLKELHTRHLAALRSSPLGTLKASGRRALDGWQRANEQIEALSAHTRALAIELKAVGEQRQALRSLRSELVQELILAYGNTLVVIDGITYDFGETAGTYYLRPRTKGPRSSKKSSHTPQNPPKLERKKPRKVRSTPNELVRTRRKPA